MVRFLIGQFNSDVELNLSPLFTDPLVDEEVKKGSVQVHIDWWKHHLSTTSHAEGVNPTVSWSNLDTDSTTGAYLDERPLGWEGAFMYKFDEDVDDDNKMKHYFNDEMDLFLGCAADEMFTDGYVPEAMSIYKQAGVNDTYDLHDPARYNYLTQGRTYQGTAKSWGNNRNSVNATLSLHENDCVGLDYIRAVIAHIINGKSSADFIDKNSWTAQFTNADPIYMTTNAEELTNAIIKDSDPQGTTGVRNGLQNAFKLYYDENSSTGTSKTGGNSIDQNSISEKIFSILLEQDPDRVGELQEGSDWSSLLRVGDLITFNIVFKTTGTTPGAHKELVVDVTIEIRDHVDTGDFSFEKEFKSNDYRDNAANNKLLITEVAAHTFGLRDDYSPGKQELTKYARYERDAFQSLNHIYDAPGTFSPTADDVHHHKFINNAVNPIAHAFEWNASHYKYVNEFLPPKNELTDRKWLEEITEQIEKAEAAHGTLQKDVNDFANQTTASSNVTVDGFISIAMIDDLCGKTINDQVKDYVRSVKAVTTLLGHQDTSAGPKGWIGELTLKYDAKAGEYTGYSVPAASRTDLTKAEDVHTNAVTRYENASSADKTKTHTAMINAYDALQIEKDLYETAVKKEADATAEKEQLGKERDALYAERATVVAYKSEYDEFDTFVDDHFSENTTIETVFEQLKELVKCFPHYNGKDWSYQYQQTTSALKEINEKLGEKYNDSKSNRDTIMLAKYKHLCGITHTGGVSGSFGTSEIANEKDYVSIDDPQVEVVDSAGVVTKVGGNSTVTRVANFFTSFETYVNNNRGTLFRDHADSVVFEAEGEWDTSSYTPDDLDADLYSGQVEVDYTDMKLALAEFKKLYWETAVTEAKALYDDKFTNQEEAEAQFIQYLETSLVLLRQKEEAATEEYNAIKTERDTEWDNLDSWYSKEWTDHDDNLKLVLDLEDDSEVLPKLSASALKAANNYSTALSNLREFTHESFIPNGVTSRDLA